ncbi:hypothetical protein IQ243_13430 [Nostocales cyanobacterium LEGE 11386]|nr:hypothetical protein [Nostocales cyanobacterium LEGE 11386]
MRFIEFTLNSHFSPGLLENVYEMCLIYELRKRGLNVNESCVKFLVS